MRRAPVWPVALTAYERYERAAGKSPQTLRIKRSYLQRFGADHPDPWRVTTDEILAFLAYPFWQPATRKSARGALSSFYLWAYRSGRIPCNPAADLPVIRVPPGVPRPAPDHVVARALTQADHRVRRAILLGALGGLRRAEIAKVHARDIVGDLLYVRGKGGRVRAVPLHPVLARDLGTVVRWAFPGPHGHLSPDYIGRLVSRALGGAPWTAHTLRHKALSEMYAVERDLRAVQQIAGHAKITTTEQYTQVPDGAVRRAVHGIGLTVRLTSPAGSPTIRLAEAQGGTP